MKVRITHLKAPWPAGAVPGDVVDLVGRDEVPAWAVGKCSPAGDDIEATHVVEASKPAAPAAAALAAPLADVEAQAAAERAAAEAKAAKKPAKA